MAVRSLRRGLTKDFSPVTIKSLLNPFHPYGLMSIHMTYPIKRFSTLCRIGGFGYRTISSLPHRQSPRIRRLLAMFTKRSMPFELWLGRGRPLNPYLKGSLVEWLRRETAPKDLHLFPDEARLGNVGDFFEAPVVNRSWKTETTDPQLVRFGLLWKVDDWLALKGLDFQVPILESSNRTCVYFRGGVSGTEFLVEASGLDQPRASRGVVSLYFARDHSPVAIRHKGGTHT